MDDSIIQLLLINAEFFNENNQLNTEHSSLQFYVFKSEIEPEQIC